LVEPNGTVLLLDDTCYFIGFDTLEEAKIAQSLLNKPDTQAFIASFMFTDAKRAITKDLLMRIDMYKVSQNTDFSNRYEHMSFLNKNKSLQMELF